MKAKHQVHNLIILDESGSMNAIKHQVIRGFNEIVQTVKAVEQKYTDQEHFISFVTFNGLGITEHLFNVPVRNLQIIDENSYKPCATTPLYDAMGFSFSKLEKVLHDSINYNVLVTVFTDGEENASKEFSGMAIKEKIEELKDKRWTFTYTGTDHDVHRAARRLSIKNVVEFTSDEAKMKEMFENEIASRFIYSENIRSKKDTSENFYSNEF
ncbi:vWA domain-containing protein [Salegentibacter maritimus]|uniref:vWA domain-containing protein n=1 Tax=Salegentibacter maritimus TaxID=2794347 RepID=UPI0018E4D422|nr:vWA domain-containing protein [Salegentibacter maritimus]MBI6115974.1 VWA domain-containing protein [Salegentibacter maritimus]